MDGIAATIERSKDMRYDEYLLASAVRSSADGLFAEKVRFALNHYQWQMEDGSTVINQLLEKYSLEGIDMPYTMEQFRKEYVKAHLGELDPEEVLSRFAPEDRLKGLEPEDRLKGLEPEDVLAQFQPEEVEAYLKKLKKRKKH